MIFTESENARVRKNIIHHLFSIAALCAVVFTNTIWLTGCVIYDSKDLAKFAKEQLYEKYERVAQGAEQGIWKMSIDEFNQKMEEIREDELYR